MPSHAREVHSNLFMVRVWLEEVDDGRTEWRGKIQRVIGGETLYFRDWESMLAFLRADTMPGPVVDDEKKESGEEGTQGTQGSEAER